MKIIKLDELSKRALLALKEPFFLEHDGNAVGYSLFQGSALEHNI